MRCPECGSEKSKIANVRVKKETEAIKRRRECLNCQHRFTTYEFRSVDLETSEDPLVARFLGDE